MQRCRATQLEGFYLVVNPLLPNTKVMVSSDLHETILPAPLEMVTARERGWVHWRPSRTCFDSFDWTDSRGEAEGSTQKLHPTLTGIPADR